ncbi:hypothetical protein CspeluHIS016_0300500 [Cutaneotrichosporon spelunceum]|uniref:Secreted protein n=1 Tax=Cutaneotrichosporon spelunceum TaxID=1672016 RepID=A0AAD3YAN9_9TREE|nr:hypothetical protein CspeluHIS016_0300500 [Cutaneotrichosporon spelunceum]
MLHLLTTTLAFTAAAAAAIETSALVARAVTCRQFVHNPDTSSWDNTIRFPPQQLGSLDCTQSTNCTATTRVTRVGWKHYWDTPASITVALGAYDPAVAIGTAQNEVVIDIASAQDTSGAYAAFVFQIVRVQGTLRECDDGAERAAAVNLPENEVVLERIQSADSAGVKYFGSVTPGSEASVMSSNEVGSRQPNAQLYSSARHAVDARLAVPLAAAFLLMVI